MNQSVSKSGQKTPLEEFLLTEYDNIARAHFNTSNSISNFFKHYIIIASAPITLVVLAVNLLASEGTGSNVTCLGILPTVILSIIAAVGLFVMLYVSNLRFDALMYARTVNGIRSYFYEASQWTIQRQRRYGGGLPRKTHVPRYFEWHYFLWVVLTFGLIDSLYVVFAILAIWVNQANIHMLQVVLADHWLAVMLGAIGCLALHLGSYWGLSLYRENKYLRSFIVGVDIDGVLNKHREQFCKLLKEITGKELDPREIVKVPVHEIPGTDITEDDERLVFNTPEYWTRMPARDDAPQVLLKLRNSLNLKVHIFSLRGWPDPPNDELVDKWHSAVSAELSKHQVPWYKWLCYKLQDQFRDRYSINVITSIWLRANGMIFDRLTVEKGNLNWSYSKGKKRNRFHQSMRDTILYFIEDQLEKAVKLSSICEVVYLIDHPYNQADAADLPPNIVRVKDWNEIYVHLRDIG